MKVAAHLRGRGARFGRRTYRECRGGDLNPGPPDTPGAPRSGHGKNPMSPTLHQAEPPRRPAHGWGDNKGCEARRIPHELMAISPIILSRFSHTWRSACF